MQSHSKNPVIITISKYNSAASCLVAFMLVLATCFFTCSRRICLLAARKRCTPVRDWVFPLMPGSTESLLNALARY